MEQKISAIDTQEGGSHYKDQKVQPMELAYYIGGTPAFCKLSKYMRVKEDQAEDLRKAYHCIEFEEEMQYYAKRNYTYQDPEFVKYWINRHTTNKNIRNALRYLSLFDYVQAKRWVITEAKERGINLDK
ncbi:hypothetical protein KLEP7_gp136 [Pseudaeromonas phage vB_PpeM_ KLEP7]|nr:hypothetical protein KLEP7_gp136 [Pseudaeromonas phage vB_PpeM_ KLEP7]